MVILLTKKKKSKQKQVKQNSKSVNSNVSIVQMFKNKKSVSIILAIVFVVLFIAVIKNFADSQNNTIVAFLHVESGLVEVNSGSVFVDAVDEMKLNMNDIIKTGSNGYASIVLYESVIVSLDPNTEILVADLAKSELKLKQKSGTTWNKFTNLLGVNGMSVQTPTTVISVRGTSFEVTLNSVVVAEGIVNVEHNEKVMRVKGEEKLNIYPSKAVRRPISDNDRLRIIKNIKREIKVIKKLREVILKKNSFSNEDADNLNKLSEESFLSYLEKSFTDEVKIDQIARLNSGSRNELVGLTEELIASKELSDRFTLKSDELNSDTNKELEQQKIIDQQEISNQDELVDGNNQQKTSATSASASPDSVDSSSSSESSESSESVVVILSIVFIISIKSVGD